MAATAPEELREEVRRRYAEAAEAAEAGGCGCAEDGGCCGNVACAGEPLAFGEALYDAEQQTLFAELRFIPIEAFAWHLRHGELRADIARFAPHLQEVLASLDRPDQPSPRQPTAS